MELYVLCWTHDEYPFPRKTIKVPYSQGDVVVFGQNAGQEYVAMGLCGLIYHNMKVIGNPMTWNK